MLRSLPTSQRHHSKDSVHQQTVNSHKCYFHGSFNITKFCINKKCTLPLCQKCIPIHTKQHTKQQKSLGRENIIPYFEAHKIAIQQISAVLQRKQSSVEDFQNVVKSVRKQIELMIDDKFAQIDKKISEKFNQVKILQQKHNKIKKGSLKTLIFYFADEQGFKIKSQTNRISKLNLANDILRLTEKLSQQMKRFQHGDAPSYSAATSYRNNGIQIPSSNETLSLKTNQQKNIKFESSSDFAQVLKDQKNRLENVRNKNILLATNSDLSKNQDNFKKYGSKSVDNFYTNKGQTSTDRNKEQKENRPLQFGFKTASNGFSTKKQIFEDCQNNQQKIDKIRRKYVGDQSMSKQKSKSIQNREIRNLSISLRKQLVQTQTLKSAAFRMQTTKNLQNNLSDRILSREEIRLDIENRVHQKVHKNQVKNQSEKSFSLQEQKHNTFRKVQVDQEAVAHQAKQQQFTLNKNYQFQERHKFDQNKQKSLMSSIKKQFQAIPADEGKLKQGKLKNFFEGNDRQILGSFDVRQEKNYDLQQVQNKQQITDFITNDLNNNNQLKDQTGKQPSLFSKKREQLYDKTKQRIRLSEPTLLRNEQIVKKGQQSRQRDNSSTNKLSSTQMNLKEARRFNYLYNTFYQPETRSRLS